KSATVPYAAQLVMEEVRKIREAPVTAEELNTIKRNIIETFPSNFASKAQTMGLFASDEYTHRDPSFWQTYRDRIDAVSAADVQQAVVVPLHDGQEVQAEPGALLYMAGGVEMGTAMRGGLWGGIRRIVAGESLFISRFRSRGEGQVAFAAPHPGKLREVDLDGSRSWLCQRDSFLCATEGVEVGIAFTRRFGAGL